ncbi:hypothetical protein [Sporosarcina sp. JAI121]|uniref:hypothetical protein n=1 Tax=Sporosarcina sp. JAI121 TaxID=2723064 RepID=UPI0015CA3DD1|nr:hypothetical protein [Sporosarcina sp. JAI121]NYF25865.1 hypothetical protein [Sporosarcina sp. JAI121]
MSFNEEGLFGEKGTLMEKQIAKAHTQLVLAKALYHSKIDKEKSQTPKGLAFEWLIQISFCLRL